MLTKQPKGLGWLLSIDECPADADSPQADLLMTVEELTELRDLLTEVIAGSLGEIVAGVREQLQPAPVPVPCALCMAWRVDEDRGPTACPLCRRTAP